MTEEEAQSAVLTLLRILRRAGFAPFDFAPLAGVEDDQDKIQWNSILAYLVRNLTEVLVDAPFMAQHVLEKLETQAISFVRDPSAARTFPFETPLELILDANYLGPRLDAAPRCGYSWSRSYDGFQIPACVGMALDGPRRAKFKTYRLVVRPRRRPEA